MNYRFLPADASCMEDVYELIDRRIRWMDEVGIRQWNATDYWGVYPKEHYIRLMNEGLLFVLRRKDGKNIGCAALYTEDPRWAGDPPKAAYHVHHLATDISEKGAGRIMLKEIESFARRNGKECVRLDCSVDNPRLNRYYEEAGYEFTGRCVDGVYCGNKREKLLK